MVYYSQLFFIHNLTEPWIVFKYCSHILFALCFAIVYISIPPNLVSANFLKTHILTRRPPLFFPLSLFLLLHWFWKTYSRNCTWQGWGFWGLDLGSCKRQLINQRCQLLRMVWRQGRPMIKSQLGNSCLIFINTSICLHSSKNSKEF